MIDVIKDNTNSYSLYNKIDFGASLTLIKQLKHNIFMPYHEPFYTKQECIKYLESIRYSFNDVKHWSILPELVDVPLEEIRKLKIDNIQEKI